VAAERTVFPYPVCTVCAHACIAAPYLASSFMSHSFSCPRPVKCHGRSTCTWAAELWPSTLYPSSGGLLHAVCAPCLADASTPCCKLCKPRNLQELEQRGFFSDEGDDATPVPMADKTELGALKRAQLRMARSRPDLVYGLPEARVAARASATLPYPERKARPCSLPAHTWLVQEAMTWLPACMPPVRRVR